MNSDDFGDRCKSYEDLEGDRRAMRGLPLLARLDGRAFHTFTRDLERPYDPAMSSTMMDTTKYLVHEMNARVGYTQSDEITLAWYEAATSVSDYAFDGRFQKLASVLAGMASSCFTRLIAERLPRKAQETPHFDCRVWQVPTFEEAANVFRWREDDATKNSITMAARAYYTDAELFGVGSGAKQELLWKKGVNWNDFPAFFKRGVYVQRKTVARTLTVEERARIPEAHRPAEDATFQRTRVEMIEMPPVRKVANLEAVLFEREIPLLRNEDLMSKLAELSDAVSADSEFTQDQVDALLTGNDE